MSFKLIKLTNSRVIVIAALFFAAFYNLTFFSNFLNVYPFSFQNSLYFSTIFFTLYWVCWR